MFKTVAVTDPGRVRPCNEDRCEAGTMEQTAAWGTVCDGLGGLSRGAVASEKTVEIISNAIQSLFRYDMNGEEIVDLLRSALTIANSTIYNYMSSQNKQGEMATTAVVAVIAGGNIYIAYAGDSRAYLFRDGTLRMLTVDHSVVRMLLENGEITQEQARNHPRKNLITRAIGAEPSIEIDFCVEPYQQGDVLLLCSDGLTNHLSDEKIEEELSKEIGQEVAQRLTALANEAGGTDNISVVLLYE